MPCFSVACLLLCAKTILLFLPTIFTLSVLMRLPLRFVLDN